MPTKSFHCKQCGHCCRELEDTAQAQVSQEDIDMWRRMGRDDILLWVDVEEKEIWISPRTNDYVSRCPWLRKVKGQEKYFCRIHDAKPEHCRRFPVSRKHAKETGCRGYEE